MTHSSITNAMRIPLGQAKSATISGSKTTIKGDGTLEETPLRDILIQSDAVGEDALITSIQDPRVFQAIQQAEGGTLAELYYSGREPWRESPMGADAEIAASSEDSLIHSLGEYENGARQSLQVGFAEDGTATVFLKHIATRDSAETGNAEYLSHAAAAKWDPKSSTITPLYENFFSSSYDVPSSQIENW